jgi:hypothetical protein
MDIQARASSALSFQNLTNADVDELGTIYSLHATWNRTPAGEITRAIFRTLLPHAICVTLSSTSSGPERRHPGHRDGLHPGEHRAGDPAPVGADDARNGDGIGLRRR